MTFILSKVLWLIVRPSNFLLLVLFVSTWLGLWTRGGFWLALSALTATVAVLVVVLPVGLWLARPLEERFAVPAPPPEVDGIIVLGGAQDTQVGAARGVLALDAAAERLIVGYGLALDYPQSRLVFSGGSGSLSGPRNIERIITEYFVDTVDLEDSQVIYEDRSRNTYENALYTKAMVNPQADEVWVLVTSAWHMPRSVGIFRKVGFPVLPWPADFLTRGDAEFRSTIEASQRLLELDIAVREYIGLVAYRLLGRTTALFPAPRENEGEAAN